MERAVAQREIRRIDMSLKLYRISQTVNTGYDTYDSSAVVAESEHAAKLIPPMGDNVRWKWDKWIGSCNIKKNNWCVPEHVAVECVGIPEERFKAGDVICASFKA